VNNEEEILTLLATHGPLTAAVDAISWQDYLGGIIQFHCEDRPNHAVGFFFLN
jgi:cathepsin O